MKSHFLRLKNIWKNHWMSTFFQTTISGIVSLFDSVDPERVVAVIWCVLMCSIDVDAAAISNSPSLAYSGDDCGFQPQRCTRPFQNHIGAYQRSCNRSEPLMYEEVLRGTQDGPRTAPRTISCPRSWAELKLLKGNDWIIPSCHTVAPERANMNRFLFLSLAQ